MTGSEWLVKRGWLRKHWYDWPGGGRRVCGDELWKLSEICWLSLVETVSSHSEHCSPQHQTLHSPPDTGDNHCRRSHLHLGKIQSIYSSLIGPSQTILTSDWLRHEVDDLTLVPALAALPGHKMTCSWEVASQHWHWVITRCDVRSAAWHSWDWMIRRCLTRQQSWNIVMSQVLYKLVIKNIQPGIKKK